MNAKYYLIGIVSLLFSCNGNQEQPDAWGNFEAKSIIVSAKANGPLLKLNIQEGDALKSGERVGFVDTTAYYLQWEQAHQKYLSAAEKENSLNAQKDILLAEKKSLTDDKNRLAKLVAKDAAPKADLDKLNNGLNVLNTRIKSIEVERAVINKELTAARAQVKLLQKQLNDCYIQNPINGTVLEQYVYENELVVFGKPLYKIADINNMEIKAYVSGNQLPKISIGDTVIIQHDSGNNKLTKKNGVISWISSEAEFTPKIIQTREDRVTLTYAIKAIVKNDGEIKIGMPGEIIFKSQE